MLKEKILFYTDCSIFGGCERPFFNIIASEEFASKYEYRLIYRKTKIYTQSLFDLYPILSPRNITGVYFPDINTCKAYLETKISNKYLYWLAKLSASLIFRILFLSIFVYETIYLFFLFKKQKMRIIHINNGGYPGAVSCRPAVFSARLAGIHNIIMNVHTTTFKKNEFLDSIIDFFVRKCVTITITGSKAAGRALRDYQGFDESMIINIYHGIKPAFAARIDRSCSGGLGKNYIVMVARFEERKGHKYVIRAMRHLISEHPEYKDIKLILIGDGPLLDDVKTLVLQNTLKDNVFFFGHRTDYIDFIASSLFLLNPSLGSEDLPYVILEAMSLGIPIIGTDVCGIPEEIENEISGIVIPPRDAAALARSMYDLLADKNKRMRLGIEAKKRFLSIFTIDKMIKDYVSLYDRMPKDNG